MSPELKDNDMNKDKTSPDTTPPKKTQEEILAEFRNVSKTEIPQIVTDTILWQFDIASIPEGGVMHLHDFHVYIDNNGSTAYLDVPEEGIKGTAKEIENTLKNFFTQASQKLSSGEHLNIDYMVGYCDFLYPQGHPVSNAGGRIELGEQP